MGSPPLPAQFNQPPLIIQGGTGYGTGANYITCTYSTATTVYPITNGNVWVGVDWAKKPRKELMKELNEIFRKAFPHKVFPQKPYTFHEGGRKFSRRPDITYERDGWKALIEVETWDPTQNDRTFSKMELFGRQGPNYIFRRIVLLVNVGRWTLDVEKARSHYKFMYPALPDDDILILGVDREAFTEQWLQDNLGQYGIIP